MRMPQVNIIPFAGKTPILAPDVLVASGAQLIGDLEIGPGSSVWFNVVLRADVNYIRIGARTNIQDNSTVHVASAGAPCLIGSDVTIGHNAIVHACTVEDCCLIGIGAVVLDDAVIGRESLVGAGAVVTSGKVFPPRSLILGSPAKVVRQLTEEEVEGLRRSAAKYVATCRVYAEGMKANP